MAGSNKDGMISVLSGVDKYENLELTFSGLASKPFFCIDFNIRRRKELHLP